MRRLLLSSHLLLTSTSPLTPQNKNKTHQVLGNALRWQQAMMQRLQNQVLDWRVGDLARTGSISARNAVFQQLQTYVLNSASEFFAPVFSTPSGTDPLNKATARLDALQKYYVASEWMGVWAEVEEEGGEMR